MTQRRRAFTPSLRARAIVGLDIETSDMGGEHSYITLLSATGTAVVIEKE